MGVNVSMSKRFFTNPFLDGARIPKFDADSALRSVTALLPELEECVQNKGMIESTGKWSQDYAIYTGLGGVAVAYLRLALHLKKSPRKEGEAEAHLRVAHEVATACLNGEPRSRDVSFFCGTPGYLALSCVTSHLLGDAAAAASNLRALFGWTRVAVEHEEDELLFGRAGFLYALLWVRCHLGAGAGDFDTPLRQTAERLIATGKGLARRRYENWPLMWHCFDEPYLGAAHGVVGILTMLFKCWPLLASEGQELVAATLRKLLSSRFRSGNIPIVRNERGDEHVHWCHGASGLPGLLCAAMDACGDENGILREAALQAGSVVWERGVVLKGHGLCHGIAGNGYAFLSLYRLTGDANQLQRAHGFAALLGDPAVQAAIAKQPDEQRKMPGVPDSPRSLMEGSAGVLCFLLDVITPNTAAFPAWEL